MSGIPTGVLPSASHILRARSRVSADACGGKASSISFIRGTGLNGCRRGLRTGDPVAEDSFQRVARWPESRAIMPAAAVDNMRRSVSQSRYRRAGRHRVTRALLTEPPQDVTPALKRLALPARSEGQVAARHRDSAATPALICRSRR
jgi:hypothetical protein